MPALTVTLAIGGLLTGAAALVVFDRWSARASVPLCAVLLAVAAAQVGAAVVLAVRLLA